MQGALGSIAMNPRHSRPLFKLSVYNNSLPNPYHASPARNLSFSWRQIFLNKKRASIPVKPYIYRYGYMRLGGVVTKEGRKKKEVKQRRKQAAIRSILWISTTYRGKNSQDMKNARDYIEKETKEQGIYIYIV